MLQLVSNQLCAQLVMQRRQEKEEDWVPSKDPKFIKMVEAKVKK